MPHPACILAVAGMAAIDGVLLVPDVLTVAGLPAIAGAPGIFGLYAFAFVPAVACVLAVAGIPAVAGVLAIASVRVDRDVPILAVLRTTDIELLSFSAIGISNIVLANSRNYQTRYRIKASIYRISY
jgi:hypothetical protein